MMTLRLYLEIAGACAIFALAGWIFFGAEHHEHVKDVAIDSRATQAVEREADAQTEANAVKAAVAAQGADSDQKRIDAYAAAHPIEPIRLCQPDPRGGRLPQARTVAGGVTNSLPGPGSFSAVPERPAGPDISEGLTELVLAASRLAVIDAERQQR
jgi:hypothetical protein